MSTPTASPCVINPAPATITPRIRCEIVREFARLEEFACAWESIVAADSAAEIFHSWKWARAAWSAYSDACTLCAPVVYEREKVLGILPLVRRGKALQFLGFPGADYNDVICAAPDTAIVVAAALDALLGSGEVWSTCVLSHLPEHSRIIEHFRELPTRLRRCLQLVFLHPSSTVLLGENRAALLDELIRKRQLRRSHNKLQRLGALRFRHVETRAEIHAHLERFFRQHIARHAMKGVTSPFSQAATRKLYAALVDELDPQSDLRFSILELNSNPLAYGIGFQQNRKLLLYQQSFDIDYWDYCPGDALLRCLFRYVQEQELSEFDFSIGDESYKAHYANQINTNFALYLDRSSYSVSTLVARCARRGKGALRKSPTLSRRLKSNLLRAEALWLRCQSLVRVDSLRSAGHWASAFLGTLGFLRPHPRVVDAATECQAASTWGSDRVECVRASLEDLAVLCVPFRNSLTRSRLEECRRRLKMGDRAYFVRASGGATHVVWIGHRGERAAAKGLGGRLISLETSTAVLYDWWTTPDFRFRQIDFGVLRAVIQCESGHDIHSGCTERNDSHMQE